MKLKYNEEVIIKRGLHRGRKGRLYAHVFWIFYLVDVRDDGLITTLWFNVDKFANVAKGEQDVR